MPAALTSLPFRAGAFSLVSAVFGAGLVAMAEFVPAPEDPFGGAPVFEVTLYQDAGTGVASATAAPPSRTSASKPAKPHAAPASPAAMNTPDTPVTTRQVPHKPIGLASLSDNTAPLLVSQASTPATVGGAVSHTSPQSAATSREKQGDNRSGSENAGARNASLVDEYEATVIRWIERHKRHPGQMQGIVTLAFSVDRRGRMRDCRIARSSGDTRLDQTALAQVNAAAPFPRPPRDVVWQTRQMQVRLDYRRL